MIQNIAGVPAHPLFVHLAVISAPVAACFAIGWAIKPRLRAKIGTTTLILSAIAALSLVVTASAGEALLPSEGLSEENLGRMAQHAFLGDVAKFLAIALFLAVLAFWWLTRSLVRGRRALRDTSGSLSTGNTVAGPNDSAAHTHGGTPASGLLLTLSRVLCVLLGLATIVFVVLAGHEGAVQTWLE